jgi:tripeptidyl-peptidase-1
VYPQIAISKLLAVLSTVAAAFGSMVVHEHRKAIPSGFTSQGAAPASEILTLRVALASNNLDDLEAKLTSLATPGSSEFRQWLSMDEVQFLFIALRR